MIVLIVGLITFVLGVIFGCLAGIGYSHTANEEQLQMLHSIKFDLSNIKLNMALDNIKDDEKNEEDWWKRGEQYPFEAGDL